MGERCGSTPAGDSDGPARSLRALRSWCSNASCPRSVDASIDSPRRSMPVCPTGHVCAPRSARSAPTAPPCRSGGSRSIRSRSIASPPRPSSTCWTTSCAPCCERGRLGGHVVGEDHPVERPRGPRRARRAHRDAGGHGRTAAHQSARRPPLRRPGPPRPTVCRRSASTTCCARPRDSDPVAFPVVGEVRGGVEAVVLLQALGTGHDGSLATVHANDVADALRRLEVLVLQGAPSWPLDAVREQVHASIDVVVHVARGPGGVRRISEVAEVHPTARDGPRRLTTLVAGDAAVGRLTGRAVSRERRARPARRRRAPAWTPCSAPRRSTPSLGPCVPGCRCRRPLTRRSRPWSSPRPWTGPVESHRRGSADFLM